MLTLGSREFSQSNAQAQPYFCMLSLAPDQMLGGSILLFFVGKWLVDHRMPE